MFIPAKATQLLPSVLSFRCQAMPVLMIHI